MNVLTRQARRHFFKQTYLHRPNNRQSLLQLASKGAWIVLIVISASSRNSFFSILSRFSERTCQSSGNLAITFELSLEIVLALCSTKTVLQLYVRLVQNPTQASAVNKIRQVAILTPFSPSPVVQVKTGNIIESILPKGIVSNK